MRFKSLLMVYCSLVIVSGSAPAGNLYKVAVRNSQDAAVLSELAVEPLIRTNDGYLIYSDNSKQELSGLEYRLVAADVPRDQLYVDTRYDNINEKIYQVVFKEDQNRIFRIDRAQLDISDKKGEVFPLRSQPVRIIYQKPYPLELAAIQAPLSLDSIANGVSQDSLEALTNRLQAFYRRFPGTDSSWAVRDWAVGKFHTYGYDSVVCDSFPIDLGGPPIIGENIIAYKTGTTYPNHYIIVGAHRDGVPEGPAADDNASGTAGVMEIARIFRNINTDYSMIFILFDGHEEWLWGSWHYANAAAARGDSIILMLDMDMIGHYQNNNRAIVYSGPDDTFSRLWGQLGNSYFGIYNTSYYSTNLSDHFPFIQNGYRVTFAHEYITSTVYHSVHDSTTYMNFEYMTRMVKTTLATAYVVDSIYRPTGTLTFSYPEALPERVTPGESTLVTVEIGSTYDIVLNPGTVQLHYSINGAPFEIKSMNLVTPGRFQAAIPAVHRYNRVRHFVMARDTSGTIYYYPDLSAANQFIAANQELAVLEDDFETDKGWTVSGEATQGKWNRGRPVGGGDRGDPLADFDGSGRCYATDTSDGDSDVEGGNTFLDSPTFDLSEGDARIKYARWYSNDYSWGASDYANILEVLISNDNGASWVTAEVVGPRTEAIGGWHEQSLWAGDLVSPSSNMKVRFRASDFGQQSTVEAALDAFKVITYSCPSFLCGDANGDGKISIQDVTFLINFLYKGGAAPNPTAAADVNFTGNLNLKDITYLINFLYKQGQAPNCP
jgi:Peptidase family M28/Dockerin type I domain